jgi:coenzyme F420-reducing hydrogenase gamma subunit
MKNDKQKIGTMDLILLVIGIFLALFTVAMIVIHCITGSTPDTLITCVFGICGVEGGVMGWIKTSKNKLQKLKSKQENSNLNEITEILEDENELEEETFEP